VIVAGSERPAMSVAFADPRGAFSGYSVIFAELDPDDLDDATPTTVVCLHCLIEGGDGQLARGLDLARAHGQVDFDPESGEWFVPDPPISSAEVRIAPICGAATA
jgi:hypothetical protein